MCINSYQLSRKERKMGSTIIVDAFAKALTKNPERVSEVMSAEGKVDGDVFSKRGVIVSLDAIEEESLKCSIASQCSIYLSGGCDMIQAEFCEGEELGQMY